MKSHCKIIILALFCALVWVGFRLCAPIIGEGDLQANYSRAIELVENGFENGFSDTALRRATFPGTVTYPFFLAVIMKIFGVSEWTFTGLNIAVMIAAVFGVYFLLKRRLGEKWALVGAALVGLHPFTVVYISTCNAELLFGGFVLLSFCAYDKFAQNGACLWLFVSGILLGISTFFRPLGIIMLGVYVLAIIIRRQKIKVFIVMFLLLAVPYFAINALNGVMVKYTTGYDAPSALYSYGWNLYVGASENGTWNQSDSDEYVKILETAENPTEIHKYFLKKAIVRYKDLSYKAVPKNALKLRYFLNADDYIAGELNKNTSGLTYAGAARFLSVFCKIIDWPIMILCVFSCVYVIRKERQYLPLVIYLFLSAAALSLLEIAPRYTVSYRMIFCVLAVFVAGRIWGGRRNFFPRR